MLLRAANTSAMLLYIITNAVLFSFVLTNENIPSALADWILAQNLGWFGFLLMVNVLLLVAGNFMEPNSIILIMAPILAPAAKRLGIDLVHFGIVIDVNMEVGPVPPACRLEFVRRVDDRRHAHHRSRGRGLAVAGHDARLPRARDVLAGADAVPAAPARHDVSLIDRCECAAAVSPGV